MVKVRVYGKIRTSLGSESPLMIDIGKRKIRLRELIAKLPGGEEYIKKNIALILINGKNCIFTEGMNSKIGNNDIVDLLPPVAGG